MSSNEVQDRTKAYYSAYCMKKCEVFKQDRYQSRKGRLRKECVNVTWVRQKSELLRCKTKYICLLDCKSFHWDGEKYVCLQNMMLSTDDVLKMKY